MSNGKELAREKINQMIDSTSDDQTMWQILVVDDSFNNRDMLVRALKARRYKVDAAEDGEEALEKCRETYYDLVLMDLRMPRLDGVAATRAIHGMPERQAMKIMAITASVSEETQLKIVEADFCGFVTKPVHFDELFRAIHHQLQSRNGAGRKPDNLLRVQEMMEAIGRMLELGDVEALAEKATRWLDQPGYGQYPPVIIQLCKELDLQALEALYHSLKEGDYSVNQGKGSWSKAGHKQQSS